VRADDCDLKETRHAVVEVSPLRTFEAGRFHPIDAAGASQVLSLIEMACEGLEGKTSE
jgi:hypothetical protein